MSISVFSCVRGSLGKIYLVNISEVVGSPSIEGIHRAGGAELKKSIKANQILERTNCLDKGSSL